MVNARQKPCKKDESLTARLANKFCFFNFKLILRQQTAFRGLAFALAFGKAA
jgi:hypothetical protein